MSKRSYISNTHEVFPNVASNKRRGQERTSSLMNSVTRRDIVMKEDYQTLIKSEN